MESAPATASEVAIPKCTAEYCVDPCSADLFTLSMLHEWLGPPKSAAKSADLVKRSLAVGSGARGTGMKSDGQWLR